MKTLPRSTLRTHLARTAQALALAVVALALLAACETTVRTDAAITIRNIPEVSLVAPLDTLSKPDADRLRTTLELRYERALFGEAIVPVYWRDDLHADLVLFAPAQASQVQTLKVEVSGWRRYHVTTGTRNGKPFQSEGLLPAEQ